MKRTFFLALFVVATLAWAAAQQPSSAPGAASGQAASPSSQAPGTNPAQPATPGASAQPAPPTQASNLPVTEGCLGGSNPNFTVTDKSGGTYKLNIPPNADASKLAAHVGEPVQVLGNVNDAGKSGGSSIDVRGIGKGTGNCPGGAQTAPPKQ